MDGTRWNASLPMEFDFIPLAMRVIIISLFFLVSLCLRAQTVTATWTFTTITGATNPITSFVLTAIGTSSAPNQTLLLKKPLQLSRANCSSLTNGFVTTNVICGVFFQATVNDGYSINCYTNYFPLSVDGTNVNAWAYLTNAP